jgi:hypothetical protein
MFLLKLEESTGVFNKVAQAMTFLATNIDAVITAVAVMAAVFVVGRFLVIAGEVLVLARNIGVLGAALQLLSRTPVIAVLSAIAGFATFMAGKKMFAEEADNADLLAKAAADALKPISQMPGQLTGVTLEYQKILKELNLQLGISTLAGDELKIQTQLLTYKKQLEGQITTEQSKQLENLIREIDLNQRVANIRKSISEAYVPRVGIQAQEAAVSTIGQNDPVTTEKVKNETILNGYKKMLADKQITQTQYDTLVMNQTLAAGQALANAEIQQNANKYATMAIARDEYFAKSVLGTQGVMEAAKTRAEFEKKTEFQKAQFGIEAGAQMFSALGAQNKKAFEAAKAFNIANAIMNTYMAATKALASYPFPFSLIASGAAIAMGMAQVAQIRSQSYSGRALGGPVMGNTPYMVGESGPELFTPSTTGTITRNGDLNASGGGTNINFNIQANDAQGFDDLLIQRRGMITQFINDAMAEQGQRSRM